MSHCTCRSNIYLLATWRIQNFISLYHVVPDPELLHSAGSWLNPNSFDCNYPLIRVYLYGSFFPSVPSVSIYMALLFHLLPFPSIHPYKVLFPPTNHSVYLFISYVSIVCLYYIFHIMKWNDWCFKPWCCTVRLYWAGDNLGKYCTLCFMQLWSIAYVTASE